MFIKNKIFFMLFFIMAVFTGCTGKCKGYVYDYLTNKPVADVRINDLVDTGSDGYFEFEYEGMEDYFDFYCANNQDLINVENYSMNTSLDYQFLFMIKKDDPRWITDFPKTITSLDRKYFCLVDSANNSKEFSYNNSTQKYELASNSYDLTYYKNIDFMSFADSESSIYVGGCSASGTTYMVKKILIGSPYTISDYASISFVDTAEGWIVNNQPLIIHTETYNDSGTNRVRLISSVYNGTSWTNTVICNNLKGANVQCSSLSNKPLILYKDGASSELKIAEYISGNWQLLVSAVSPLEVSGCVDIATTEGRGFIVVLKDGAAYKTNLFISNGITELNLINGSGFDVNEQLVKRINDAYLAGSLKYNMHGGSSNRYYLQYDNELYSLSIAGTEVEVDLLYYKNVDSYWSSRYRLDAKINLVGFSVDMNTCNPYILLYDTSSSTYSYRSYKGITE